MIMDIYHITGSPPARSVEMVAKHLGIPYNLINVDLSQGEHIKTDFLKINPQHQVPVINDNGYVLSESRAIMRYLINAYCPDSSLYPKDPKKRGEVDRILDFDCSTLAKCQIEALYWPIFSKKNVTDDHHTNLKNALKTFNEYLTRTPYAAGDHLTLADLSIFAHLTLSEILNLDLSLYPKIEEWMKKLKKELPYHEEINVVQLEACKEMITTLMNKK